MAAPKTYAEWVAILDRFAKGDDTVFEEMNAGSFLLDAGTAQRFYARVEEAYKARKQAWLDKFQRSFQMHHFRTIEDFGIALRDGKQNLLPLSKFVTARGLPEDLKNTLHQDLEAFVGEIRKSLKENVSRIENGREKMLMMLSTFGLFENPQDLHIPPTGRKIIF